MANEKQAPKKDNNEQPTKDVGLTEITLKLTLNEVQTVLHQIGNGSHNQVRAIIDKIADQTNPQIPQAPSAKIPAEPAPAP